MFKSFRQFLIEKDVMSNYFDNFFEVVLDTVAPRDILGYKRVKWKDNKCGYGVGICVENENYSKLSPEEKLKYKEEMLAECTKIFKKAYSVLNTTCKPLSFKGWENRLEFVDFPTTNSNRIQAVYVRN